MINYDLFEFAAPPCTNVKWYIKACQLVGLGPGFSTHAYEAWDHGCEHRSIRLSLVRNPADWLVTFYNAVKGGEIINGTFKELSSLDFTSLDHFFDSYLENAQGGVTALYNRYEADIVHKVEDAPWAFLELLDSLDVPNTMKGRLGKLPLDLNVPVFDRPPMAAWLVGEIHNSEWEVYERFDYW